MTQLDLEVILRKLKTIKKYLDVLKTKENLTQKDYDDNLEQQIIVERSLHVLIESAVDINTHIVVSYQKSPPETYRDSFIDLGKAGVISTELARELAPAAGLRNRLVHDYEDIDATVVRQSIALALRLLPKYSEQIRDYLQGLSIEQTDN